MLMGRVAGGENNDSGARNEFSRPVRTSIRAPNRRVDRHASTRLAVTQLADDEKKFKTDRMHNVKVNVLISEVRHFHVIDFIYASPISLKTPIFRSSFQ